MPVNAEYIDYILGQISSLGNVTYKRMFGGIGLFQAGTFFALIDDDLLYFKVDDITRDDYTTVEMEQFRPFGDQGLAMPYYEVPESVLTDTEGLRDWALNPVDVVLRAKKKKKRR
jgi:DNA transformation protein